MILASHGFLPTRGSFMLDLVFLAMFGIILALGFSIYLVRKGKYELHRKIQITSALVLLVAIIAFEVDMRFVNNWRALAEPSAYFESGVVDQALWIHLCFAIPCPFVWAYVIFVGSRRFSVPAAPNAYSAKHRFWGRIAAGMMLMTSVTGWVFYVLAFVL